MLKKTLLEQQLEESILVMDMLKKLTIGIDNPNLAYALIMVKRKIKAHKQHEITKGKIRQWAKAAFYGSKEAARKRKNVVKI